MDRSSNSRKRKALRIFREHGGIMRTHEALDAGIHPETLYALRDSGALERMARGLYRLAGEPPLAEPDLVIVARKVPSGVICLISALAFHDLTTQIPHAVHVAIPSVAEAPRLEYPPLRIFRFGGESYAAGIERSEIDGVHVPIYGPEKTIADCFKYRNRIGLDVALDALRAYRRRGKVDGEAILRYARICRVERVMRPYLEAIL